MAWRMESSVTELAAATFTAATTAAATAFGFLDLFVGRNAAELEGHADVFGDIFLDGLQGALGVHKVGGDFVVEKGVTRIFESFDFGRTEFDSSVLLLVKFIAFFVDGLVLELRGIVGKEAFDICL